MAELETLEATGTPNLNINQLFAPEVQKASSTSIFVNMITLGMTGANSITTYRVTHQRMVNKLTSAGIPQIVNSSTNPVTITGLVPDALYKITTQAISSTGEGNRMTVYYRLASSIKPVTKIGTPKAIGVSKDQKSFLKITGGAKTDNKYTFAFRNFDSIQLPTYTTDTIGEGAFARQAKNYSVGYYSFGTMVLMPSLVTGYEAQGAGIGFFMNEARDSGYFITIDTVGTSANLNSKPVKIFKLKNKQIKQLQNSQKGNAATLDSIFGGRTYNIDVRVKIQGYTLTIIAYINGFKITATDTTGAASNNQILDPSKTISLVGTSGVSMFDYVYADTITATQYDSANSLNFYKGQFTKDFIEIAYGDMIYNASTEDTGNDSIDEKKESFDEFGTVVREIARRKIKLPARPSVPVGWTTGGNNLAQIMSQSYNSFTGEVMVLNNSSITVPLSDKQANDLSIFGYDIGFSGDIEYSTDPVSENSSREPVIFESQWLQSENDVKKLAEWIQSKAVNKSNIVEMEVFGNPLISVGDIITVDYAYQGFTSDQKIIVVKVSHSFEGGLSTRILGRTL